MFSTGQGVSNLRLSSPRSLLILSFFLTFPNGRFRRFSPQKKFTCALQSTNYIKKVKWSRYRPCVAQRVGRGIALHFHDRSTRRGWVVSSTPRPHFTPGKDPVPILQETGWAAPGLVWTGGKSRPHRDSIPDRPARSQSLYRLSYPTHTNYITLVNILTMYWEE